MITMEHYDYKTVFIDIFNNSLSYNSYNSLSVDRSQLEFNGIIIIGNTIDTSS